MSSAAIYTSKTPVDLVVRNPNFDFPRQLPKYWYGNDPFMTHHLTAFSIVFGIAEHFVITGVRNYKDQIQDAKLKKEASQFIGQEAFHSKEHAKLNRLLYNQGFAWMPKVEQSMNILLGIFLKILPKRFLLASTAAIEHMTTLFGRHALQNPEVAVDPIVPEVRELFRWHAYEELEHKAVCFDVNEAIPGPSYILRVALMPLVLAIGLSSIFLVHILLLAADGRLLDLKMWRKGFYQLWNKDNGVLGSQAKHLREFFRRDFHPWNHDDRPLLASMEHYDPNPGKTRIMISRN